MDRSSSTDRSSASFRADTPVTAENTPDSSKTNLGAQPSGVSAPKPVGPPAPRDTTALATAPARTVAKQSYDAYINDSAPLGRRDAGTTALGIGTIAVAVAAGPFAPLVLLAGAALTAWHGSGRGDARQVARFATLDRDPKNADSPLNKFVYAHRTNDKTYTDFMAAETPKARKEAFDRFAAAHPKAMKDFNVAEIMNSGQTTAAKPVEKNPEQEAAEAVQPPPPKPAIQTAHIPEILKEAHAKVTKALTAFEEANEKLNDSEKARVDQADNDSDSEDLKTARKHLGTLNAHLQELRTTRNTVFESIVEGDKDLTEEQLETLGGLAESASTEMQIAKTLKNDNMQILATADINKANEAQNNINLYRMKSQRIKTDELFTGYKDDIAKSAEDYYNQNKARIDRARAENGIPFSMAQEELEQGNWDRYNKKSDFQEKTRKLSQELETLSAKNKKVEAQKPTDPAIVASLKASQKLEIDIITHLQHGNNRTGKGLSQDVQRRQDDRLRELQQLTQNRSQQQ